MDRKSRGENPRQASKYYTVIWRRQHHEKDECQLVSVLPMQDTKSVVHCNQLLMLRKWYFID